MTREEAFVRCPADSYVEFYSGEWVIVSYEPVQQPQFFYCHPGGQTARTETLSARY